MINNSNFLKWNISNCKNEEDIIDIITKLQMSYLLKVKDYTNYDMLEQFVFNLSRFHLDRLDKKNYQDFYVEFSNECIFLVKDDYFKEDKLRINPIVSSYTFFNKSITPLAITNIDFEKYKYKEFTDENELILVFPNKMEHVSFNGNLYHGFKRVFDKPTESSILLKINIYDKKPTNIEYYESLSLSSTSTNIENIKNNLKIDFNLELYHTELILDTTIINKNFMENMLYEKNSEFVNLTDFFLHYEKYIPITNHLQKIKKPSKYTLPIEANLYEFNYLFVLKSYHTPLNQTDYFLTLINKYGYIMYDILDCYINNTIVNTNKFYKKHIFSNFYSEYICEWIIKEINIHSKNFTVINIEKIPYLFRFFILGVPVIMNFIKKMYDLNDININIITAQIIKENKEYTHEFNEKSLLKVIIPLNDYKEVLNNDYKTGDLIVSNNILRSVNNKIIEGEKITLVYYLDFIYS